MQCGGTITEFEKMTLGDIFDVINTHVDMQQEQIKQREKQQKKPKKILKKGLILWKTGVIMFIRMNKFGA